MLERNYYLNQIISKMWDGNIKVITGIRRCGKSTLLFELFNNYLINNGIKEETKSSSIYGDINALPSQ